MDIENKKFRCHCSIIIEKCGRIVGVVGFFVLANITEIARSMEDGSIDRAINKTGLLIACVFIAILTITLVISIINWRKTTIVIEEEAIIWEKNTLNKETLTIGIKNISSINIERNLFERIIGTAKLKIDTNSLSTAESTDVEYVFKYEDALMYKEHLEAKVKALSDEKEEFVQQAYNPNDVMANFENPIIQKNEQMVAEYISDGSEIVKHCLYEVSVVGLVLGLAFIGVGIFALKLALEAEVTSLEEILFAIVIIVSFTYATFKNIAGKYFNYYNLAVSRKGSRIYMKYGMFKIKEYVIPIEKINAIHIKQSLIGRIAGKYNVSMECVGVGDEQNETAQLTLSLSMDEIISRLSILLPEYNVQQVERIELIEKKAICHKLTRFAWITFFVVCLNVGIIIAMNTIDEFIITMEDIEIFIVEAIVVVLIYVFAAINMFLQMKTEAVGYGETHLIVATGSISRDIVMTSYDKMQYVTSKKSPISIFTGLTLSYMHILAGPMNQTKSIPYISEQQLEVLTDKMYRRK